MIEIKVYYDKDKSLLYTLSWWQLISNNITRRDYINGKKNLRGSGHRSCLHHRIKVSRSICYDRFQQYFFSNSEKLIHIFLVSSIFRIHQYGQVNISKFNFLNLILNVILIINAHLYKISFRFSVITLAVICFVATLGMNDAYVIQPRTMQKGKFPI